MRMRKAITLAGWATVLAVACGGGTPAGDPPPRVPPPALQTVAAPPAAQVARADTVEPDYADDFSRYRNDEEFRRAYSGKGRRVWNFGGVDWAAIEVVDDPVFGKALRTTQQRQAPFFDLAKAPQGKPGAVQRTEIRFNKGPLSGVWVRFYVRFAVPPGHPYGWRTKAPSDPSPHGGAYKIFFLHWDRPYRERGAITYSNSTRLDAQFYVTGLKKVRETRLPGSGTAQGLSEGGGAEWRSGEWLEMTYYYQRRGGNVARAGAWVRRYSSDGRVSPGPYRWWLSESEFAGPPPFAASMELGGNKNHGNEFDQYVIWGPWRVVDAERNPNPFGVPMR